MSLKGTGNGPPSLPLLVGRGVVGGVLMGLANLVPGISGGTMLLAAGVYPAFIHAIAEVTTFRIRVHSLVLLGTVVASGTLAILLLAGSVKGLVVEHRWIMYSIFVGLTLGGVPVVKKMIREPSALVWLGAAIGFMSMVALAWFQVRGGSSGGGGESSGSFMLMTAGIAGASAMILPGVSGGYLLLVLGQYVPILSAIDQFKDGMRAMDVPAIVGLGVGVGLPVAFGVVIGIVAVSNLLRFLLKKAEAVTLGALLGLLVGAVVGLWPFQQGVAPKIGTQWEGREVTVAVLDALEPEDYPTEFFRPSAMQVAGSLGCIIAGFACTAVIARFGAEDEKGGACGQRCPDAGCGNPS